MNHTKLKVGEFEGTTLFQSIQTVEICQDGSYWVNRQFNVPADSSNSEYRAILDWIEKGGVPTNCLEPWNVEEPAALQPNTKDVVQILALAKELSEDTRQKLLKLLTQEK